MKKEKGKSTCFIQIQTPVLGQFPCLTDMRSVTEFCVVEHVFRALLLQGLSDPQQVFPTQWFYSRFSQRANSFVQDTKPLLSAVMAAFFLPLPFRNVLPRVPSCCLPRRGLPCHHVRPHARDRGGQGLRSWSPAEMWCRWLVCGNGGHRTRQQRPADKNHRWPSR